MPQPIDSEKVKLLKEITSHYEKLDSVASTFIENFQTALDKAVATHSEELDLNTDIVSSLESQLRYLRENNRENEANYQTLSLELSQQELIQSLMEDELAMMKQQQGIQHIIKQGFSDIVKSFGEVNESAGHFIGTLKNLTNPLTGIFTLLKLSADRFSALDKGAEKFRIETGLLRSQTQEIEKNVREISVDMQQFGVDIDEAYIAAAKLTDTFGDKFIASNKENLEYVSLMAKNLGVAEETSSEVLKNFMGIGKMSSESARYMTAQVVSLSKAAGIPLNKVMTDVAKASGETQALVRGSVTQLIKASIEARRLGTNLEAVGAAAGKLLDFQSSIGDEMEASVLMGKDLNLQRARQLAYEGNLKDLAKEQSDLIAKTGKLDYYQQQALAKALGLSVEQVTQIRAKQEELSELRRQDPNFARQYEEEMRKIDNLTGKNNQDLKTKYQQELKSQQVQAVQTQLANQFKTLIAEIADLLLPVFQVLSWIVKVLGIIVNKAVEFKEGFYTIMVLLPIIGLLFRRNLVNVFDLGISKMKEYASSFINLFKKGPVYGPQLPTAPGAGKGGFGSSLIESVKSIKPAQLLSIGAAMVLFAGSVLILAHAAKVFGSPEAQLGFNYMAIAAGGLAALTVGLVALSTIITVASPVIIPAIGIMLAFAASIGILSLASIGFAKSFQMFTDGFKTLADLNLINLSKGIFALSGAMGAFGVAMAGGGILSFLGGGMMLQLVALAAITPQLSIAAASLKSVAESMELFKDTAIVDGITAVTEAIRELNKEISNVNLLKVGALSALNVTGKGIAAATGGSNNAVVAKLDELIELLQAGAIGVNIDGSKASMLLSKAQKERGVFGAV